MSNKEKIYELEKRVKSLRHEICEEIRNKLKKSHTPACGTYIIYYEVKNVEDVLDEIEKGETDEK